MAGTRSSARQAANASSSPSSTKDNASAKRKADETSSPEQAKSKRGRPSKASKEQKTLEETLPTAEDSVEAKELEMKDATADATADTDASVDKEINGVDKHEEKGIKEVGESFKGETKDGEPKDDPEKSLKDSRGAGGLNALDQVKADENDSGKTNKSEEIKADEEGAHGVREDTTSGEAAQDGTKGAAVEEDSKREQVMPSNILEKGIIYFFTRGRVGVDNPESVQDLQRSFFVMRPLPAGAKLTDGAIQDMKNNRLLALPKKVWPKSGKDRFMVFVEKAKTSMETLKEEFFSGSEYSTKTSGTRSTPEVTPIGEGVYAMTSTGGGQGTTHLAYMLTIPSELGEVQKDVGIAEKGSFVLSLKNPEASGPANAQLPQTADFPKEFIEEFRGRSWMAVEPKHLEYANAQMLLIGEDFDSSSNLEASAKDERNGEKETPQEELEKLENEDELRVEHLKGDDTVFDDLGISKKDYPQVMTTW